MIITLDGWNGSGKTVQANALHEAFGVVPINYFKSIQDKSFVPMFDARNDMSDEEQQWFDMCFGRLSRLIVWKSKCASFGGHASIEHFYSDIFDVIHHFKWSQEVRDFAFHLFDWLIDIYFPRERLHSFYLDVPVDILPQRRPHERYGDRLKYEDKWISCWRWLEEEGKVTFVDGTLPPERVTDIIVRECGL